MKIIEVRIRVSDSTTQEELASFVDWIKYIVYGLKDRRINDVTCEVKNEKITD